MQTTGIVRKVDGLGRIVLPMELRRTLDISDGGSLEIFEEDRAMVFRKYQPGCIFCGSLDEIVQFKGKKICKHCLKEMQRQKRKV